MFSEKVGHSMIEAEKKHILLPSVDQLKPVKPYNTFGECGFNDGTFKSLPVEHQLEVVKDVVRQAIEIDYHPDLNSEKRMAGDCTTAAKFVVEYGRKLGLDGEFGLASVRKNVVDGGWRQSTRHVVATMTSGGITRTIDATPMAGFGYGTVSNETFRPYLDITTLTKGDLESIEAINVARRKFKHLDGNLSSQDLKNLVREVEQKISGNHMNSWLSELYFMAGAIEDSQNKGGGTVFFREATQLDPFKPKILGFSGIDSQTRDRITEAQHNFQETALKNVGEWTNEARKIWGNKLSNQYHRGINLLQWTYRELNTAGLLEAKVPSIQIGKETVPLYCINPRFVHDKGLVTAWVKPSSYWSGVTSAVKETLREVGDILWEYDLSLTDVMEEQCFASPLALSHPHGERPQNEDCYTGHSTILLLKANTHKVNNTKRQFRQSWGRYERRARQKVLLPGTTRCIEWNECLTNYLHSTDSAAESVVHLLLGYPHLSLVTRWDYPHPNL